jgi:hypothetical protein
MRRKTPSSFLSRFARRTYPALAHPLLATSAPCLLHIRSVSEPSVLSSLTTPSQVLTHPSPCSCSLPCSSTAMLGLPLTCQSPWSLQRSAWVVS